MESKRDFHLFYFYEFKLGHNAAEASRNINQAFGDTSTSKKMLNIGFKNFVLEISISSMSLEGGHRSSLMMNNYGQLWNPIRKKNIRKLASGLRVGHMTISRHLKKINNVSRYQS